MNLPEDCRAFLEAQNGGYLEPTISGISSASRSPTARGAVYYWRHEVAEESDSLQRLADSFAEFLEALRPRSEAP